MAASWQATSGESGGTEGKRYTGGAPFHGVPRDRRHPSGHPDPGARASPTHCARNAKWQQRPAVSLGRCSGSLSIPIADSDARHLIATLLADGSPDARTAASQISKGVERGLYAVGLTPALRPSLLLGAGLVEETCEPPDPLT